MPAVRTATPVDDLAERYLADAAALNPSMATHIGLAGHDDALPELTPDWHAQVSGLHRRTLAALDTAEPVDSTDRVTIAALRDVLDVAEQLRAAGADEADLNNIASPVQSVRDVFDLMATNTADDWATIATRLGAVPATIAGYTESLRFAAARGHVAARRQVRAAIEQCADNTGPAGFFAGFARDAAAADGTELPASVRADLQRAGQAAATAYEQLGGFLRDELLDRARTTDPVGRELYALHSRAFLGSTVDLDETYAWGQDELARITAEMGVTADRIKPGASTAEAIAELDARGAHTLAGTTALQEWMQGKSDAAVAALAGTHFDIPDEIRTLECRIAPTQHGGIYYTGPSDDLVSRPGRMWWSVPKGVTEFATWRELSTVYHEGVPGHHLQIAQTAYLRDRLNSWRRLASWVSGHGEGWALYAERLMAELGYLDDPADYLGLLDSQSLRAARVVIDIGVHCGLPAPAEVGGGEWTYDKAWQLLTAHSSKSEGTLRFELDRYLGWPGQAPAYKIGERLWLQLRADADAAAGDGFDLREFHQRALNLGSVGLDVLRAAVLGEL
jgi:uncharacterized protein (DUF885 family)